MPLNLTQKNLTWQLKLLVTLPQGLYPQISKQYVKERNEMWN